MTSTATSTTATPDPPRKSPAWGAADTLWIAWLGKRASGTASDYPDNYTNYQFTQGYSPPSGPGAAIAVAAEQMTTGSEDPNTFTIPDGGNSSYGTLAIKPLVTPPPPPLPATPVLDDFNRPNEDPLSQGGAWASTSFGGSGVTLEVISNQAAQNETTGFAASYRNANVYGDAEVYATVSVAPGNNEYMDLYLHLQQPALPTVAGYRARWRHWAGTDSITIQRFDAAGTINLVAANLEPAQGDTLLLRRIGEGLELWRKSGGSWAQLTSTVDTTYWSGKLGVGSITDHGFWDDFGGGALGSESSSWILLDQYAPELRYDVLDTFRADSAAMMTDNDPPGDGTSNLLWDGNGITLASAEPFPGVDDLSLDYLGLFYPPGGAAQGRVSTLEDYIDAENSYEADAQRMQSAPGKVYGRAVAESGGMTTLQYWFFYYFNWHPALTNIGDHEGDWEMIQLELDSFGIPIRAAYAQHGGGETCAWSDVSTTMTGRPIVFVAQGSHASYFRAGSKPSSETAPAGDEVGGNAPPVTPSLEEINPPAPGWLDWLGKWGGSGSSPHGPPQQTDKWLTPASWADNQSSCWEGFLPRLAQPRALPQRPPAPKIVATRVGKRVRVTYSFAVWPSNPARRPVTLITSVQPSERRFSPLVHRYRITARRGTYTRPLGLGSAPFKLFAAAYSRQGRSSTTVMVRIRSS